MRQHSVVLGANMPHSTATRRKYGIKNVSHREGETNFMLQGTQLKETHWNESKNSFFFLSETENKDFF